MQEAEQTEWWHRILADAKSIDKANSWETAKMTAGVEAAAHIDLLTREQADYIHAMVHGESRSKTKSEPELREQTEQRWWNTVLTDAKAIDKSDGWQRLKVLTGMNSLRLLNCITKEQVDHIESIVMANLRDEDEDPADWWKG